MIHSDFSDVCASFRFIFLFQFLSDAFLLAIGYESGQLRVHSIDPADKPITLSDPHLLAPSSKSDNSVFADTPNECSLAHRGPIHSLWGLDGTMTSSFLSEECAFMSSKWENSGAVRRRKEGEGEECISKLFFRK